MESLRVRNEKLAAEVSRLRAENKSLKDKVNKYDFPIHRIRSLFPGSLCPQTSFKSSFLYMFFLFRLLSRVLNIPEKKCKNKSVQTNIIEKLNSAGANRQLKGATPSDLSTQIRKEEPFSSLRNPFRYSPPLYNLYDVGIFAQFSPARQAGSPKEPHLVSPQTGDELLPGENAESKIPSSAAVQKNSELICAIDQNLQTPVRALFQEDCPDSSKSLDSTVKSDKNALKAVNYVGTPMHAPPSARLPRSVSKIKSYKEPSLSVKVRKGFKFFSFEDP